MALVSTRELIEIAEKGNFALPAFNVPSLEFILWVLEEAEERKSPVILQLAPVEYRLLDLAAISASVVALSGKFSIPFSLHLDHSHEPQDNMDALLNHFSSVMIDGSRSPLAANIQLTRKVVEMAHLAGALVEGEIGRVG
ncbi:MAG: class II fructose-bisphosphate aldolase, partial [Candidatus Atribacteria bacterium]|nr:class II fructose-bisphosphate aldolase [Candidatus Atribacteria bacterium]